MSRAKKSVRLLFAAFLILNVLAFSFPAVLPFNRIRPFVFGLPFVFFWFGLWIVIGFVVLIITDAVESR